MKKVLSLLVAFVFMQTQTWALSGGPVFPSTEAGPASLIGSYGGVLIPATALPTGSTRATSLGVFTLDVPDTGLTTGDLILFIRGTAYTGTVSGVTDPESGEFAGVVEGASTFQIIEFVFTGFDADNNPQFEELRTNLLVQGALEAEIVRTPNSSTVAARLEGQATLETFRFIGDDGPNVIDTVEFEVSGFQQTEVTAAPGA